MRVKFALSGALLLFLGCNTIGQEITATILGTVTDASGAVVSGATIIVVNTDQAIVVRRLTTSNNGEYVVPLLPIGHYDVSAEAPGFKTSLETGIELNVNDRRAVNFILQIHGRAMKLRWRPSRSRWTYKVPLLLAWSPESKFENLPSTLAIIRNWSCCSRVSLQVLLPISLMWASVV